MGIIGSSEPPPPPPPEPVSGFGARIKNLFMVHYRGIFGMLGFLILLPIFLTLDDIHYPRPYKVMLLTWTWMGWFWFWQPVAVPVTGMIPIFLLPLTGTMSTVKACQCYFNENIALMVLAGMLHQLLNVSGLDKRIALGIICMGSNLPGAVLLWRVGTAAFFLSVFSNRLLVTKFLTECVTSAMVEIKDETGAATEDMRDAEPNYNRMSHLINNCIHTSSTIGSLCLVHASLTTLAFRATYTKHDKNWIGDIFNYLNYTTFAFPTAFVMFILNMIYHTVLIVTVTGEKMSSVRSAELSGSFKQMQDKLPRFSVHEGLSVTFLLMSLACFFTRWHRWFDKMGWAHVFSEAEVIITPEVLDATVAALFVAILHILPGTFEFLKLFTAKTMSEMPPIKPESGVLWWKFVDKNTVYAYLFAIGGGTAIDHGLELCRVNVILETTMTNKSTYSGWMLMVIAGAGVAANMMSGIAVCGLMIPLVMRTTFPFWTTYTPPLAVGMASSFGFMCPFLYTTAYHCHYTGKVPRTSMAIYSIGTLIICIIVLWLSLVYYAPIAFDTKERNHWGLSEDELDDLFNYHPFTTTSKPQPPGREGRMMTLMTVNVTFDSYNTTNPVRILDKNNTSPVGILDKSSPSTVNIHLRNTLDTELQFYSSVSPRRFGEDESSVSTMGTEVDVYEEASSVDAPFFSIDNSPSVDTLAPETDLIPSLDTLTPSANQLSSSLNSDTPSQDSLTPTLDTISPSLDSDTLSPDTLTSSMDTFSPSLDSDTSVLDTLTPSVSEGIASSIDSLSPVLDALVSSLDTAAPVETEEDSSAMSPTEGVDT